MIRETKTASLVKLAVLAVGALAFGGGVVPAAQATFGENFGPHKINDGAGPLQDVPAFPDTDDPATPGNDPDDVFWAGACDRAAAPGFGVDMAPAGGYGNRPTSVLIPNGNSAPHLSVPAPFLPQHCIDWGASTRQDTPWVQAPAWRLPSEPRAGAHPDGTATTVMGRPIDGNVDNIIVDLPAGFVGNPEAIAKCPADVFAVLPPRCPSQSQVGVINLHLDAAIGGNNLLGSSDDTIYPVWNLEPRKGRAAELGFAYASGERATTVRLEGKVRSGSDNGITAFVGQIPAPLPVFSQAITLWGVPWAAQNDLWRGPEDHGYGLPCGQVPGQFSAYIPHNGFEPHCQRSYDPSWGAIKPFLTNETDCNQRPVTTQRMDAYSFPGSFSAWDEPEHGDANWATSDSVSPAVTKCETLGFAPNIDFKPTTSAADAATGLGVDLSIPQNNDAKDPAGNLLPVPPASASPSQVDAYAEAADDYFRTDAGRATAHLKDTVVTLPPGVAVNPSAATGLEACSDAVVGVRNAAADPPLFHINDPADGLGGDDCPKGSRIGTVEVDTPLLGETLTGDVILGEPKSTDPQSGQMFRMFLLVRSAERGILVKIYGTAVADPSSGQITATFRNNPELPFSDLRLDIKGGDTGVLAMPRQCGSPTWRTAFTPWSSVGATTPVADTVDGGAFGVDQRCGNPFSPTLAAGMNTQAARSHGTFSFRFTRQDGEQWLRGLTARLPQGLLAKRNGVPLCSNAAANAGSCPAASKIGIVDAAAGSGSPFVLEQKGELFLTEGYKGGQYGLAVKIRPIAGPFRGAMELSPIVVRQAIHVDRKTAQVTAISDPFPLVHHGVPLRVREVTVLVDRPEFMLNPSDCSAERVGADLVSDQGAGSIASNPFQAGNCPALVFKPKFALSLTGRKQRTTGKHPGIRAVVTQQGIPEAGIERAEVRLPKSLALDVDNAQALCEFEDGTKPDLENHCPKGSIVGRARAVTPLLPDALTGNVYFVKNVRRSSSGNLIRTLPMIVVALRGEIAVNLVGESNVKKGKLVNTFDDVPDAPISRFNLNIDGGKNGIIAVTRTRKARIDLCKGKHVAEADMDGQNGRRHDFDVRMKTACAKKSAKGKRKAAAKRKAASRRAAARRRAA